MTTGELMNIGVSGLVQTVLAIHLPPSSFGGGADQQLPSDETMVA